VPCVPLFFCFLESRNWPARANPNTKKTHQNSQICSSLSKKHKARIGGKTLTRRFRVGSFTRRGRFPSEYTFGFFRQNQSFLIFISKIYWFFFKIVIYWSCQTNLIFVKDGCIIFFRDNYTLFCHNYITEFVKNADSIYVIVVTPFSRKVSLATIGVCVFVRLLR
jgi:hypothetical protein